MQKSIVVVLLILIVFSCRKISFINSPNASLSFSTDTLHFDTAFTTTGSVTQSFKIFNQNDQKLRLSQIQLIGGSASPFKINVDGTAGVNFSGVELEPGDSIYVFVSVTINPNTSNLPFVVTDSILVSYNGNNKYLQLQAYGQNAHFFRNKRITADTIWNNNLPFVILGGLSVDSNVTLTINKGCKIYTHADAPLVINGSLKVNGGVDDSTRVVFSGDRLDPVYRDLPAGWPGITFTTSSINNVLTYVIIKNAYQGIVTQSSVGDSPKITLNQCIIDNIYDAGIVSVASSIKAVNCLISNCGNNISIAGGGLYSFDFCTVASYATDYIDHKKPVLFLSNSYNENLVFALIAHFRNCIFYGDGGIVPNELIVDKKATAAPFDVAFENVLYKNKDDTIDSLFTNSIKNQLPEFDSIDAGRRIFNFRLKPTSPAINKGVFTGNTIDLDGKMRGTLNLPDLGCYEQ
ncbi:hypothetical protein [Segetibacter koreensis]|uniref:hypothetical protein n=1 Tax=Segetibacter koreensis TaxID=398037 RepID=UPI000371E678|nr:hypothetical protein [Segetibacter koreensis]